MSAPTHTPGPWTVDIGCEVVAANGANDDLIVARTYGPDQRVNARLIAAAPELAEALRRLLAEHDDLWARRPVAVRGDAQVGNAAREALERAGLLL